VPSMSDVADSDAAIREFSTSKNGVTGIAIGLRHLLTSQSVIFGRRRIRPSRRRLSRRRVPILLRQNRKLNRKHCFCEKTLFINYIQCQILYLHMYVPMYIHTYAKMCWNSQMRFLINDAWCQRIYYSFQQSFCYT
jgi:hypothetical protein